MYRKLKTLFILIMTSALLLSSCFVSTAAALENPIKILIDGEMLKNDTAPLNSGGRVLVPFRAIFEALGATVTWDPASSTAMGRKGRTCIFLQPGNKNAMVILLKLEYKDLELTEENLEAAIESVNKITLDVPAMNKSGRLLVPARFIAESLGADVDWKADTRTVIINTSVETAAPGEVTTTQGTEDTASGKSLIGTWSSIGPSGSLVDPSTGAIKGGYYNGTWYVFRSDGTFRMIMMGSGTIISGAVVHDGKYSAAGGVLKLTGVKESWYPDPAASGQQKAYKDKSVDGGTYLYELEEDDSKLRLRDQETTFSELFYRVVEG